MFKVGYVGEPANSEGTPITESENSFHTAPCAFSTDKRYVLMSDVFTRFSTSCVKLAHAFVGAEGSTRTLRPASVSGTRLSSRAKHSSRRPVEAGSPRTARELYAILQFACERQIRIHSQFIQFAYEPT